LCQQERGGGGEALAELDVLFAEMARSFKEMCVPGTSTGITLDRQFGLARIISRMFPRNVVRKNSPRRVKFEQHFS